MQEIGNNTEILNQIVSREQEARGLSPKWDVFFKLLPLGVRVLCKRGILGIVRARRNE